MTAALRAPLLLVESGAPKRFVGVAECAMPAGDGPCTRTECRYHLAHRGHWEHRLNPTRDCALAVANEGPRTLEEIAEFLGMSKERARQIEEGALEKLKRRGALRGFYDESE